MLGVVDAAAELGVSPRRVRQMLANGAIHGERVGRAWVIGSEQLHKAGHRRSEVGRPWSAASAWAVLAIADGEEPVLSAVERSRARKRLAEGLDSIGGRLGARADQRSYYAHPSLLDRLANVPGVVRSGVSAALEYGADLLVGETFEGYVRSRDLDELVSKYGLDDQAARPNVLLRVVDDSVWPFQRAQRSAGRAVVAVDLLDSAEPRTRRAGTELLDVM